MRLGLLALFTFTFTFAIAACGDSAPAPKEFSLAGLQIQIYERPARLVIADGELVLFDGMPGGKVGEEEQKPAVALAMRSAIPRIEFLFGAFKIEEQFRPEAWRSVRGFGDVTVSETEASFSLLDGKGKALGTGRIESDAAGELSLLFVSAASDSRMSIAFGCDDTEHFLGFGGQSFDVDHRGQTVPIWVQEAGIQKVDNDNYNEGSWFIMGRRHSSHTPMPMYLSSRGYGLALDTSRRSIFSMCSESDDTVRIEAWDSQIALHLFRAPTPLGIIEKMTAWTGRPDEPPAFTFAPWLDAVHGEENVQRVATALRNANIPSSVIWSEDWRGGSDEAFGYTLEEDWRIDRDLYPNVEALASSLHDAGYKFFSYINTFVDDSADVYDEVLAKDYGVHREDGSTYLFDSVKFNKSTLIDLSNPEAFAWAKGIYKEGLELGFDGYMADFAEWLPHDAVLASGEDPMARHNLYPVDYQRLNKELFDEMHAADGVERLFFVRSAYLGSQPLVSVVWAGDQQTDFSVDDGIPTVIPLGIGLGVTGFPYFGHDIAGYMSEFTVPTTKELFFRWVTLGALSPVMRTHHGRSARENWNWESDAETTEHFRRWATLHMQLYPYFAELARQVSLKGAPLFRPLALDYPDFELGWTSVDQFMLGDRIIVAPIVVQGAAEREVQLPEGTYFPLLGGAAITGGTSFTATASIEEIPAFVPAGTLLVLLPETVQTLTDTAVDGTVSLADVADDRVLWLYPGGSSSWQEGEAMQYSWTSKGAIGNADGASFEGSPVTAVKSELYSELLLEGPGVLTLQDGSTLEVAGGAPDRAITVRIHHGE